MVEEVVASKVESTKVFCYEGLLVRLRPQNVETDFDQVMKWVNDPEITKFLKINPPITREDEMQYFQSKVGKNNEALFAIDTLDGEFIGNMGIHNINWRSREGGTGSLIGNKEYWGKGYGADAKMLVLYHAFYCLGLHRISSSVYDFNGRSYSCLEKTGYVREGVKRNSIFAEGKFHDRYMYGILEDEFKAIWPGYKEIIDLSGELSKDEISERAKSFFKDVREKNLADQL